MTLILSLFPIPLLVLSCGHGPISHTPQVLFRILPIPIPQTSSKTPAPLLAQEYHRLLSNGNVGVPVYCSEVESAVFRPKPAQARDQGQDQDDQDQHYQEQQSRDGDAIERLNIPPAEQREEARRAGRRLVQFGFRSQGVDEDRPVEAVQDNKVVEASFAKGEWAIRWANASG